MPGYFTEDPAETFRRNIWINPFWEDDVHEVVEHMGADRVIFGSDWPHIEGMPRPLDYAAELKAFDDDDAAQDPARQRPRAEHASSRLTLRIAMADTATIASLATAVGTLVLAVATFASTRSANHSARIAERALDLNLRPVLIPAHEWEPTERITFHDQIFELRGGFAAVEERDGNLYFAAQLRNVGAGIGVLTSWKVKAETARRVEDQPRRHARSLDASSQQQRSLYVPAGDVGYWQGAIRDGDTDRGDADALRHAIDDRRAHRAVPPVQRPGRRPRHGHPLHAHSRRERRLAGRDRPALDALSVSASARSHNRRSQALATSPCARWNGAQRRQAGRIGQAAAFGEVARERGDDRQICAARSRSSSPTAREDRLRLATAFERDRRQHQQHLEPARARCPCSSSRRTRRGRRR